MSKESLVHSFNGGKVLYVEPNDIYGYTKDDEGHSIPITPPYQDLCISFDLIADVYSRTNAGIRKAVKDETENDRKTSYIMSFHSKPRMDSQTFLRGTGYGPYNAKDGKFEDYYLTTYYAKREFGAYIADKQVVEGLGVESVQISMENWYTPTIVINFVDVRGVALWGQEEAIRDDNGTISVENVFGSFFTLPYPVFHLIVKGFFGRPVTYQLSLSSFKGNYDMDGSFKVTATFIGYQYSLLTDIPMRYLVAAPFCDYEGRKYWEAHVNSEEWKLSDGSTPPKLYDFYENVKGAIFKAPENEIGNLPDTTIVSLEKERRLLSEMKTETAALRNKLAYQNKKVVSEMDDVTHHETLYFFDSPDYARENTATISLEFNQMKDTIEALGKTVSAYKSQYGRLKGSFDQFHSMINNLLYGDINNHDGGVVYDGKNFALYRYFTYDDDNLCISDLHNAYGVNSDCLNRDVIAWFTDRLPKTVTSADDGVSENQTTLDLFNDTKMTSLKGSINIERWETVKKDFFNTYIKRHGKANNFTNNVYVGKFQLYDAFYQITQRISEIDEEIKSIRESIDKNRKFDILEAVGFRPYIGDFLKIVMCHMETFIHIIKQSERDAEMTRGERVLTNASWTDWNDRQLLNDGSIVPSWVGVTKTETKLNEYSEGENQPTEGSVSWLGAFEDREGDNNKFVETTVVNSLVKALACTMTTPDEPKNQQEDANTMTAYSFYPTLPFDFNSSENIFDGTLQDIYGNYPFQSIVGYIGLRLCQIAASSQSRYDEDVINSLAELDAYNWYKAYQNGTKFNEFLFEPLKEATKEGAIDDIIFGILSGTQPYYDKYKLTASNGKKFYPHQIIGGTEEQIMLKAQENDDNVVASYINKNGLQLTPSTFRPFNNYRYSCIQEVNENNIYPEFDENNLAKKWISPNKMYDGTNPIYAQIFANKYNHDVCNIIDNDNVIGAIKDRFWLLKDKKRFVVSEEYVNEMPNYDKYLTAMYSNFDRDYEKWYVSRNSADSTALQAVIPSKWETEFNTPVVDQESFAGYKSTRNVGNTEMPFKNKNLRIRSMQQSDIIGSENGNNLTNTADSYALRNDLVMENVGYDTSKNSVVYERINRGSVYFPTCAIYAPTVDNKLGNYTNLFLHTAYYNTPFKYFVGDEALGDYSDNESLGIRLRKLFRCALFLFSFRYSSANFDASNYKFTGLKRMPKGLILQLGAMAWWRKMFDFQPHDKFVENVNSDFPRYRGQRALFPLVKTLDGEWLFAYYGKGEENEKYYVTYEETPLFKFTQGDMLYENMLRNRFEEFAILDRNLNNELIFDTIREKVEVRFEKYMFDANAERNYVTRAKLYHESGVSLYIRLTDGKTDGSEKLDWEHFTKSYRGIYVNDKDLDGVFRYDGEMAHVQEMLRSIYLDDWVMLTTISVYPDSDSDTHESYIKSYVAKSYIRKLYNTWRDIADKTASNMNVAYLSKLEASGQNTDDSLEVVKIGIYNYIKNLYDKWLLQVDESMFNVKNFYKTNFYFMTSYYENIYSKLVVNCETVTELYKNMAYEQSLFNYIDHVLTEHNCQLFITPDFIPFGQNLKENKEMLYDVFKPYSYQDLSLNSHYNGMNMASYANCNRFIAVLKSEIPNTIAPPTYTEYKHDGFTMVTEIGEKDKDGNRIYAGTDDLASIFPTRNAELLNDKVNYNELRDNTVWDGAVPCFGVTMSRQNQHLFENVALNMENPIVTDISARTYEDIVNVGKSGERRVYFHGQDIYKVYSSYSYGCSVTMLGNAQIQPLMYFQLNNIPMWHGAYMIYKVTHTVSAGEMKTVFDGQRVSRRRAVINQQFANGASLMDYSVEEKDEETSVLVAKATMSMSTMNKLSKRIEVKPYEGQDCPFKDKKYHQSSNNVTAEATSEDPKYFPVLMDTFNELVQLNNEQGFGDTIKITSLYRQSSSSSDHSNPRKYSDIQYENRNCAMDLQVSTVNPKRDHCIDLYAPYLLYLLKRGNGRQILLEIGKPSSKDGNKRQDIKGDDTYINCFHVSLKDGALNRHDVALGFMTWQKRLTNKKRVEVSEDSEVTKSGKDEKGVAWGWHRVMIKVGDLPPSIAKVFLLYLEHCKSNNDLKTFAAMTKRCVDFGLAKRAGKTSNTLNYDAVKELLTQTILKHSGDNYSKVLDNTKF